MAYDDDGRGLNLLALQEIGLLKGKIDEFENHQPSQIAQLVFVSGLSTSNTVSEYSGRGIGMNAVQDYLKGKQSKISVELKHNNQDIKSFAPFRLNITIPKQKKI